MSSSSPSLDHDLHVNAVVFRIREELLSNPMLTDIHLRDHSGAIVKTVSTNAPQHQRRLSRKDTETITESTASLNRLSKFYSRILPNVSVVVSNVPPVVMNIDPLSDDDAAADQSSDESSQSQLLNEVKEQQEEQVAAQEEQQAELPEEQREEEGSRYPKRARQPVEQQEQKYNATSSPASKRKKSATVPKTDFEDKKAEVNRYYRLFKAVYKTNISDDVSWSDLLDKVEATTTLDGADDAMYRTIATDLTGQCNYYHTFKMITYYLRGVLAINLKQRYKGKKYQQMAKELLDIRSPEDISAYPQFSSLIKNYYPQEVQESHGLAFITALKADIPWREWRVKATRNLIEIALRRFYKKKHNEREADEFEYSETELPAETKDNKDIYFDEDDYEESDDEDESKDNDIESSHDSDDGITENEGGEDEENENEEDDV